MSLHADRALQLKKMQQEGRVALVIGNANYKEQPLKNPVNDAWAVKQELEKRNFDVFYLENAKRRIMIQTIDRFIRALERSSIGLVYYAGHGVEVNGENFLIPVGSDIETEMDIKYEAISMTRLISDMQRTRSRLNIFVMDACRNNPYHASTRGGASGGLANVEAEGFFIAFATSPGKVAKDGDGKHGLFTKYFLKYIKKEGMPLREVFHNVRQSVYRESHKEQLPLVRNGIGMGEFYFTLPKINYKAKDTTTKTKPKQAVVVKKEPSKYSLSIDTNPDDAHIYITNIKPKYHKGIRLSAGTYNIKITASGYETYRKTIDLTQNTTLYLQLNKKYEKVEKRPTKVSKILKNDSGYWRDPESGLFWQDDIQKTSIINWTGAATLAWEDANAYCKNLSLGSYNDWRLPSLPELFSIVDYSRYQPAINSHIKNVAGGFYWTSSYVVPDTSGFFSNLFGSSDKKPEPTQAWVIYFLDGSTETATFSTDGHVRCVRGSI
jgi:hypothetical protein